MPIVAPQHAHDEWRPQHAWPEDCYVQWGRHGIVLQKKGSRRTAFFEAFPKNGIPGFIRGEGADLEGAEQSAFAQWTASQQCQHAWGRRGYLNGGGICRHCKAFGTVFEEVVQLGAWRKPLSMTDLEIITMGSLAPASSGDDVRSRRYRRRLALRAKLAGIDLPPPPPDDRQISLFEPDPYLEACMDAVVDFYVRERDRLNAELTGKRGTFVGLIARMAASSFHRAAVERGLIPEEPAPVPAL